MKRLSLATSFLLLASLLPLGPVVAQPASEKGKKIKIKNADKGYYQKSERRNRLIGNVIFEHEGALVYCDSAWLFSRENRIQAYSNVRVNQGDSLFLWGDYLEYNGNTRLATVTGDEVRLDDTEMTLITTRLDFDRNRSLAYYHEGGRITSEDNVLTSQHGSYHTHSKIFDFKDSVKLINPEYVIEGDTLRYGSSSRIAYFEGPTTITSDSSFIYCENGRYNTISDIAQFRENAYLYEDHKFLTGDSLYYEKYQQFGEAFENVRLNDTLEDYLITGGYGRFLGASDSTFVTFDPIYSVLSEGDSLHIHGDTLFAYNRQDSIGEYKQIKVYRKVKIYKSDLQGKCDSLSYSSRDSAFQMYYDPIIWSDSSQVTGDTIFLTMRNDVLDSLKIFSNGFILSENDLGKYNQIKGRNMFGKFLDNDLRRVYVNGNGQTIYFPKDDKEEYIGMNRAICSNILIKLRDNEVRSITFLNKPEAKLHPLSEAQGEIAELDGLRPRFEERPASKQALLEP